MERTRRNIGLAGLAALVAGLSGCGAMIAAIGAQRGNPGLYTLGQGLNQLEASGAGRDEIVVIQNSPASQIPYSNNDDSVIDKEIYELTPTQMDKLLSLTYPPAPEEMPDVLKRINDKWYLLSGDQKKVLRHYFKEGLPDNP